MRKLKFILPITLIALVVSFSFTSCEQREDWRFPELGNGGFVKFTIEPFSYEGTVNTEDGTAIPNYHIGEDPAESSFTAFIEDPNQNAASVSYVVRTNSEGVPEANREQQFLTATSFPAEVSYTTADMAALFGVDAEAFSTGDYFEFEATITTVDGKEYNARQSACDPCPTDPEDPDYPGSWNGGNIDQVLVSGGTGGRLLPAVWYRVEYLAASD